jgi:hypothetical protein
MDTNTSIIFTLIPPFLVPTRSHWYPPPEKAYFSLLPFIFIKVHIDIPRRDSP